MPVKVQVPPENVETIKNNKVTFVKNFSDIEDKYDFNFLVSLIESVGTPVDFKDNDNSFFKKVFQIKKLKGYVKDFNFIQDFLQKFFKYYPDDRDNCDIFFSFQSTSGLSHLDIEDVFIVGLEGEVMNKTFGEVLNYYTIHKGDMIYIPKGVQHKVIGLSPRVTLSVGFYGRK